MNPTPKGLRCLPRQVSHILFLELTGSKTLQCLTEQGTPELFGVEAEEVATLDSNCQGKSLTRLMSDRMHKSILVNPVICKVSAYSVVVIKLAP